MPASHAGEPRASGSGIRRVSAWILHAAQCAGVYFESRNISFWGAIYCWKMDGLSTALVRHVKPTFMEHNWPRIRCVAACLQVDMNHQVHWHCEWTNWCVIGKAMDHRSHRSLLFFLLTQGPSEKCIGWTLKQIIRRLADSSVATLPNQTKHREERNGSWIRSAECWMQCAVVNVVKGGGLVQDLRASQPCPHSLSGQLVLQSQFCHVLLATKRGRKNGRLLLTGDPVAVTRVAGIRAPSSSIFD